MDPVTTVPNNRYTDNVCSNPVTSPMELFVAKNAIVRVSGSGSVS